MMKRALLMIVFFTPAIVASAAPVPTLNLAKLVEQSDVILTGQITYLVDAGAASLDTPAGTVQGRLIEGGFETSETLKGSVEADVRVRFIQTDQPLGYRSVRAHEHQLLFLKKHGGYYEFVDPYYRSIVAAKNAPGQRGDTFGRVLTVIARVLSDPQASLLASQQAVQALWGIKRPEAIAGLQQAMTGTNRRIQAYAAAALLAIDEPSALPFAENALLHGNREFSDEDLLNLRGSLRYGQKSAVAVPTLRRLLSASEPETRRAAATALRFMKTIQATAALVQALDDTDREVQSAAVLGLSEITGDAAWGPGPEAFAKNPRRYIDHWKTWAAANVR